MKQEGGFLVHRPFTLRWGKNLLLLLNVSPLGLWAAVFSHAAAEVLMGLRKPGKCPTRVLSARTTG